MAKIRQFNILHYSKVSKMLSSIVPDEKISFFSVLKGIPSDLIQHFIPLNFRKSPESYIAINEANDVKAFITIEASIGNVNKWFIKRLFLNENSFDEGKQLIDFIVTKYGALGADTFCVLIDENDDTSAELFSKMCGFRLCSREVIWKITNFSLENVEYANFTKFKNVNAKNISVFFNECIENHFRFSLEKDSNEFISPLFNNSIKCFMKTQDNKNICAFADIRKYNSNDILIDLIVAKYMEDDYWYILKSLINYLKLKFDNKNIYLLNRNYMSSAKKAEEFLENNNCEKIQTKILLVKDFYKPIKSNDKIINPAIIFNEISGKPAFLSPEPLQKTD
ncbi:hypothetical protein IJG14_04100 [bacterium]|nr:hypothetical protein [bacterium]